MRSDKSTSMKVSRSSEKTNNKTVRSDKSTSMKISRIGEKHIKRL